MTTSLPRQLPVASAATAPKAMGRPATRRIPFVVRPRSVMHRSLVIVGLVLLGVGAVLSSHASAFRVGQLTQAIIFATAIAGLNMVTGFTGQLSIGHSAFMGLGAYTTGVLVVNHTWNPLLTIPVAVVLCFVAGFAVGLPALRIKGITLALVTLAVAVAFPEFIDRFPGTTGGTVGLNINVFQLLPPHWTHFSVADRSRYYYWLAVIVLALASALCAVVSHSRLGLAMRAVRENELAAASFGVNVALIKTGAFGLSAAICGAAGSVFAIYLGTLSADASFTVLLSITLITGLVIGGIDTVVGPIIGGFAVVFIPYWTQNIHQGQSAGLSFGLILIALIFVMPAGATGFILRNSRRLLVIGTTRTGDSVAAGTDGTETTRPHQPTEKGSTK